MLVRCELKPVHFDLHLPLQDGQPPLLQFALQADLLEGAVRVTKSTVRFTYRKPGRYGRQFLAQAAQLLVQRR